MKQNDHRPVYHTLQEQYQAFGLDTASIDVTMGFTIHSLKDIHTELPFASIVYRAGFFSFVFVKDGIGKYTTDDLAFNTVPGTVYFTNPGHYKSHEWIKLEDAYLITLSESFLKENVHAAIFEEFPFLLAETVSPRVLDNRSFSEFEELYKLILKEYNAHSAYRKKIIGNLFVVLLLKIKEYFWEDYNPIYEGNRSSQIVKEFKKMLEKHYRDMSKGLVDKPFRVQDYADAQNLHPNYLSNVITTKTGKSISAWIAEKTITEARSLLQNTATSIKEIAYLLGFTEAPHFSNYFKKNTGISPAEYRKQNGQMVS